MLIPMIELTGTLRTLHTLITADASYYSDYNMRTLCERGIPALVAGRQRDAPA